MTREKANFISFIPIFRFSLAVSQILGYISSSQSYSEVISNTIDRRYIKIMKIIPLNDRVLVKVAASEEKTASGLFIPQTSQEKTQIAVVEAIGDDETIKVKVGQKILHDKYAGTAVKADGEDYLILSMGDILAVIE